MIMKIISRIQKVCIASKISILTGTSLAIALLLTATALSLMENNIEIKYLYEYMAEISVNVFSTGVFLGLSGEFLAINIDRNRK